MQKQLRAVRRLLGERQITDPPNNDKDYTWQDRMDRQYKGKPRTPGRVLPEGTFDKNPAEMVNVIKQHSEDYGQASRRLNSYINRQGRNLQGEDKKRLYDAKESLRNAYGEPKPTSGPKSTTSSAETPVYALPPGHNLDDAVLDTGFDVEDLQMATELRAAQRLIEAEKWVKDVHPDHNAVPEGTFEKSAADIAKTLKRVSNSHKQASSRLSFYRNRGGKNVDQKKMDEAEKILKGLYDEK
jgi:hypothetical protein